MKEDFELELASAFSDGIDGSAIVACALGIKEICERIDKQNELISKQNELLQKILNVCICNNHDKLYMEPVNG